MEGRSQKGETNMRLVSIQYAEFELTTQEWKLERLSLGPINLLVGKNASGKTRCLNILGSLARELSNERKPALSSNYDVHFEHQGKRLRYVLKTEDALVQEEKFWENNDLRLDRGQGGVGSIWAEQIDGGKMLRFQTPQDELAAVARRDNLQHSFLQPLHEWGSAVRHFYFGTQMGKDRFAGFVEKGGFPVDDKDPDAVVALYKKAVNDLGNSFKEVVKADMAQMGYPLNDVMLALPLSLKFTNAPGELLGISVQEKGLRAITDQHSMSQGMFRALSVIIQVNYSQMVHRGNCILVDDVGEGMDFERSTKLVDLLREKAKSSSFQLIMTTNDQFVMNHAPLEEWSVLKREASLVRVYNYDNAREQFEYFKFVGMSNFTFFEMDFVEGSKKLEEAAAHE